MRGEGSREVERGWEENVRGWEDWEEVGGLGGGCEGVEGWEKDARGWSVRGYEELYCGRSPIVPMGPPS
jgi:hypothetical protein